MEAQEFLISLIQQGPGWGQRPLEIEIEEITKIEGGLLVTMKDGSKWRIDAVKIGGRDAI